MNLGDSRCMYGALEIILQRRNEAAAAKKTENGQKPHRKHQVRELIIIFAMTKTYEYEKSFRLLSLRCPAA